MIRFGFDADPVTFTAVSRGPDWNGWLCPVVDRATLEAVVTRANDLEDEHDGRTTELEFDGNGIATLSEYARDSVGRHPVDAQLLRPDAAGCYLLDVGYTLTTR